MSEPQDGPREIPACGHGVPQGTACAECVGEAVRSILGMAAAQRAGAAPTPLAANAIRSHELLTAHIAAGFTRAEAMQVILLVYKITLRNPPQ